jgi:hypothetical protein
LAKTDIKEGEATGPGVVQSTTDSTPTPASETPMPNAVETDPEAPPIHTGKPDVPIAQTLAAGAGEHTPPDPDEFDEAGRPRGQEAAPAPSKDKGQS